MAILSADCARLRASTSGGLAMPNGNAERALIVVFRLLMAWTFLYAASHQTFDPKFTIVGFLSKTKTFHDFFAIFTTPTMAPVVTFLVAWGIC